MEQKTKSGIDEIHVLWSSEGMSCDGDSVSVTAATLPPIESIVQGLVPGLPKVHLHNKVLARETGEDFMAPFHAAARGELGPYVFVVEGSIPNEEIHQEGYFTAMGNDPETGEPITLNSWIDKLAPNALGCGNAPGGYEHSPGHLPGGRSTARRSTGINPDSRDPILPEMPNLSPP